MAGYNYLIAKDASSVSAEISSDAVDRTPILNNANEARLTPSLYGNTHRFFLAGSKKFEYGKGKLGTTVSLFGSWTSGGRYAYVYAGDINNDESASNDLMYVPTNSEIDGMAFDPITDVNGDVQSPAAQRTAFKAFIEQDKYLRSKRGQYTEKYDAEAPWFSQVDLRILQDFYFGNAKKKQTVQVSLDFVNIGNLLSSKWGVRQYATTSFSYQPLGVRVHDATGAFTNSPIYSFDPSLTKTFVSSPDLPSRWQLQLGLRYIF